MGDPIPSQDAGRRGSTLLRLVCFVLLWLSFLLPLRRTAGDELDPGWQQTWAHVLTERLQLGTDLVFTFGPLGWFDRPIHEPALFTVYLIYEVLIAAILATLVLAVLRRVPARAERIACFLFCLAFLGAASDAQWYFAAVATGVLLAGERPPRFVVLVPGCALLAAIALVKFPFCVLVGLSLSSIVVRWNRSSPKTSLGAALLVPLFFVAGWWIAGQDVANLPAFFKGSLQISAGYSAAQATFGPRIEVLTGLFAVLAAGVATAAAALANGLGGRGVDLRERVGRLAPTGLVFIALFLAFKAGFVTHDIHVLTTFGLVVPAALLVIPRWTSSSSVMLRRVRGAALACTLAAAVIGVFLAGRGYGYTPATFLPRTIDRVVAATSYLTRPRAMFEGLESVRMHLRERFAMPAVVQATAGRPVDLFDFEQGVLFLNDLAWRPRPVFHGYMAYTPYLLRLNSAFLASDRAPEFILYKLQPRNDAHPMLSDALATIALLRDFRCVLAENGFLLLQRKAGAGGPLPVDAPPLRTVMLHGRESLGLPEAATGGRVYVALDIAATPLGALRSILYKPPTVTLETTNASGVSRRFRILPAVMGEGILVSPEILTTTDVRSHLDGVALPPITSLRVLGIGNTWFDENVVVRVWTD